MKTYARVRTDNMSGTVEGKNLVSLKFDGELENGSVVAVGGYLDGEREVREATVPAIDTKVSDLALVASPEVIKSKSQHSIAEFINEAGTVIRGYRLTPKDIFSVTKEAFDEGAVLEVGSVVELNGTGKLNAVETATGQTADEEPKNVTAIGKIILIEDEWYVIEVE